MLDKNVLISCIFLGLALVVYFFYWNRFLALVIGFFIRALYWNREGSRVWFDIGSIHFSLLAGRILLNNVSYYSGNQTIKIVKGQIQWRYWIRHPTDEGELSPPTGEDPKPPSRPLSCRIQISLHGLEWFLYNRTAAYDDITSQMEKTHDYSDGRRNSATNHMRTDSTTPINVSKLNRVLRILAVIRRAFQWIKNQLPSLDPMDLFPIGIESIKGVIILGNQSTPYLLVSEFQRAEGTYGYVAAKSNLDPYRTLLTVRFQRATVSYADNAAYVRPMTTVGKVANDCISQYTSPIENLHPHSFAKLWHQLKLFAFMEKYMTSQHGLWWQKMSLWKDQDKDEATVIGADFMELEYAKEPKLLEAPIVDVSYYSDAPGQIPSASAFTDENTKDLSNGDTDPEWGIDMVIYAGLIRYGPWADRQRADLQTLFFPASWQDSQVTPQPKLGDQRRWAAMQLLVELRDCTNLQIPFREASKDWQWDGKCEIPNRPRKREPACIQVSAGDCSSIRLTIPMAVEAGGYESTLEVHLDTPTVTSSLNDIRLVQAETCRVRCGMPTPLRWNSERTWAISITLRDPVLYLVRDHINLFTDLGKDWASGPPHDYRRFIPTVYAIDIAMHHYSLNLYLNDNNIIDRPHTKDENVLLTAAANYAKGKVTIPANVFRPEKTTVSFAVEVPDPLLKMSLPRWNTNALHAPKSGNTLGRAVSVRLDGSYLYFSQVKDDHVDQLQLKITAHDVIYKMLGWSIRYFMVLKDDYFGSFTHFSTLSELLKRQQNGLTFGDPILLKYRPGKANMLQVTLAVDVTTGTIIIPAGLPGHESASDWDKAGGHGIGACLSVSVPELQLYLRLHDHFMEMTLNTDTISARVESDYPEKLHASKRTHVREDLLMIDGIDIAAHRLFGPLPRAATYVCIWEICLGQIRTILSASDARILAAAGNAFRINFTDLANAPSSEFLPHIEPDVTFVKVSVKGCDATWRTDHAALSIELPNGFTIDNNDLGSQYHQKVTSVRIPDILLRLLLRGKRERLPWLEAAVLETHIDVDIYGAPRQHRDHTRKQIAFVQEQDRPSGRAHGIFGRYLCSADIDFIQQHSLHLNGVFLPCPTIPDMFRNSHSKREARALINVPYAHGSHHDDPSSSDAETGISEAERDARLAKARSATPLSHPVDDEENMTSMDESDDADLTDSTSDSIWFDEDLPSSPDDNETLLVLYSRICRHFKLRRGSAIVEEGAPYILVKDKDLFSPRPYSSSVSHGLGSMPMKAVESNDDCDMTTLRIRFTRRSEIRITPLIVPAMIWLEKDMERCLLGPELWIDSLLIKQLDELQADSLVVSRLNWTVELSSATLQIGQHISMLDDAHPMIPLDFKTIRTPSKLDSMAVFQVTLEDFTTSGTVKHGDLALQCSFGVLLASLKTTMDKPSISSSFLGESSFELNLTSSTVSFGHRNLQTDLGSVYFSISQRAPEFALATGLLFSQTFEQARTVAERWKDFIDVHQRKMVHSILSSSQDIPIVEPLSTIQPSYLVQRGIPSIVRANPRFKFLCHLRDCLWNLGPDWNISMLATVPIDNGLLRGELESRARALDPDIDVSSIESLFYSPRLEAGEDLRHQDIYYIASLKSGGVIITLILPSGKSGGQLSLSELDSSVRMIPCDVYRTAIKNLSQTSFRGEKRVSTRKTVACFILGDVTLTLYPHAMIFLQHIARFSPLFFGEESTGSPANPAKRQPKFANVEMTVALNRLHIQAAAENLIFEMGICHSQAALSSLSRSQEHEDRSTNNTLLVTNAYMRARSPQTTLVDGQDVLAALELATIRLNLVTRQEPRCRTRMRLVFSSDNSQLKVPRSALRLYRFIEEWRDDYLPGLESTFNSLLSELKASNKSPSKSSSSTQPAVVQFHGRLGHLGIALQVMHGTWVSWDAHDLVGYSVSANPSSLSTYTFGCQISSMGFCVSTKDAMEVKMVLPPLTVTGRYDGLSVHVLALVGLIDLRLKPNHWDKLLVIQQKFGQDFNDLLSLMQEPRSKRTMSTAQTTARRESRLKYGGYLKMKGFRIGLEGMSSTLYLECQDIGSGLDSAADNAWHVSLSNLALSLAPRSGLDPHGSTFNRRHRSAFLIVDIKISTESRTSQASLDIEKRLRISVTKMHAVMQAKSISEMSDFVDELHTEVLSRKEQRSLELLAFKEKTSNILKTFGVGSKDPGPEQTPSWLDTHVIDIVLQHVGVAIPLTRDHDLQLPEKRGQDNASVPAFLFSIVKVEFGAHRGETGQVAVTNLSFQFVPRFRQSVPNDFMGENHQTRNRLLYPEMSAQVQTSQTFSLRRIWMEADVNGFILDFDSSIPQYIFSAIDIYHKGRESVERISATVPLPQWSSTPSPVLKAKVEASLATSRVFASLKFSSGKIRLFSEQAYNSTKSFLSSAASKDMADELLLRLGAEIFNLPEVSVWAEYWTTPTHNLNTPNSEPSTVMLRSTVHSSENTLRPTMLHFLTEVINSVDNRLRAASQRRPPRPSLLVTKSSASASSPQNDEIIPANLGLRISFSLRIDRSKLELTCLPDVNVMAGLYWESGGFVINIFPAAQKVTLTGTVSGLTAGLKHGFLSEDCVKFDARNLGFTVTFASLLDRPFHAINLLSVVLDTEFLGGLRFSRLQDVLCFKAVWLDNIPVLNSQAPLSGKVAKPAGVSSSKQLAQTFTTSVLIRIRKIKTNVDLGQSISTVTLDLSNVILRTRLSDTLRELSISVGAFILNAKGNIAGCMRVQDCVFQTSQRMRDDFLDHGCMLDLRMTSGPLSVDLQSEHQKLLRYRSEPLAIEIYDDWSNLYGQTDERHLRLSFTIACSEILAVATVSTIPKIMTYVHRFEANLKAQREGASKESATFSKSRTPKVGNPLSTVAEAMLQSAKTRLKQAESTLTYLMRQHMSFRLNRLQLVAFPRTMEDSELASFTGERLRARLNRTVTSGNVPPRRDIYLSFSSLGISRYAQIPNAAYNELQAHEWLKSLLKSAAEATIVGLPAMKMRMISEESTSQEFNDLNYDFNSEFMRQRDGAKQEQEDIFITLNVSLYSWLTVLRKNLAREMEQVSNAAERQPVKAISILPLRGAPDSREITVPSIPETSGQKAMTVAGRLNCDMCLGLGISSALSCVN
ncbi:hypothetical protein M378DRAFT_192008 [Amanita muscaria Koide BX008]|uniref:Csf1 N-terminal domain-containing protein n=1 Tax=Amanita muscaria (strain Koide BX008) TaxID=946122 RepID=A0A0C2SSF5_AMAMK|nr:hypothetical protein M378DRAFT_192008 [Amanita muscaria Koide BX008]